MAAVVPGRSAFPKRQKGETKTLGQGLWVSRSMYELNEHNVVDYLRWRGWVDPDEEPAVRLLGGGVSNVVLRVEARRGTLVLKQSRRQLRVQQPWYSRLERIYREADAMRLLATILPAGVIPRLSFEDRPNYILAMAAAPEPHVVWKNELLEGKVSLQVAGTVADSLAQIHTRTFAREEVARQLGDRSNFVELRVEPFYWRLKRIYPTLAPLIAMVSHSLDQHLLCFVHGDYSPKNILVHAHGICLVDHEVAHYGDPAFDLGFFLSHLTLKTIKCPSVHRERYLEMLRLVRERYGAAVQRFRAPGPGAKAFHETPERAFFHLGLCLLARLDGASPVEYLTEENKRQFTREVALRLLGQRHPEKTSWDEFLSGLRDAPDA